MSTARALPKLEIRVRGEVNLGDELSLKRVTVLDDPPKPDGPRPAISMLPPPDRQRSVSLSGGPIEYLPEKHELRRGPTALTLKDDGLVLQYGIVGKPGCGKTHLLMHLLRQIIAHESDDPERKYGGLILDPKAALIDEVREAFRRADREEDLIVINTRELQGTKGVNLIDCMLSPGDLAETLVLAARSAGVGSGEPFWLLQMSTAFGALLTLMKLRERRKAPTLNALMQHAVGGDKSGRPDLDSYLKEAQLELKDNAAAQKAVSDFRKAVDELRTHAASGGDGKNRLVVEQFMQLAFSVFRLESYQCYSSEAPARRSLYDLILDEGKVVLVSMDPQEVKLTSVLPALMKLIFQRTVVSRFGRYRSWELHNCERPVLFMADEYHTVATKVTGMFGDSEFFSLARQFGALCFVATQSLQQLVVSSLEDAWKAIFDVLSAVIVMSGNDPETKKYVEELAGNKVVIVQKRSLSFSEGKETISVSPDRLELPVIPVGALQMLTRGQAIVVGKIGGQEEASSVRYLAVPDHRKD